MIQRAPGRTFFPSRINSSPEMSGMRRSVSTRSKSDRFNTSSPSFPWPAVSTVYPSSFRTAAKNERIIPSSSTTRMFFVISGHPFPGRRSHRTAPFPSSRLRIPMRPPIPSIAFFE